MFQRLTRRFALPLSFVNGYHYSSALRLKSSSATRKPPGVSATRRNSPGRSYSPLNFIKRHCCQIVEPVPHLSSDRGKR